MKKKITIELEHFKKLGRMADFTTANRYRFEADTPAANLAPVLIAALTDLNALTASQATLENRLRELSRAKTDARVDLSNDIEFLYHTARSIAAETPGFDDKFDLSLQGDARLLNAARSAAKDAVTAAEIFIDHAMPADFLQKLAARTQKFERAGEEYANGKTACVVGRKQLQSALATALAGAAFRRDRTEHVSSGSDLTGHLEEHLSHFPDTRFETRTGENGSAESAIATAPGNSGRA